MEFGSIQRVRSSSAFSSPRFERFRRGTWVDGSISVRRSPTTDECPASSSVGKDGGNDTAFVPGFTTSAARSSINSRRITRPSFWKTSRDCLDLTDV